LLIKGIFDQQIELVSYRIFSYEVLETLYIAIDEKGNLFSHIVGACENSDDGGEAAGAAAVRHEGHHAPHDVAQPAHHHNQSFPTHVRYFCVLRYMSHSFCVVDFCFFILFL
jgi:hypothetical protein